MALIRGRANDRVITGACAALAGVRLRAGTAVIARDSVILSRIRTLPCRGIAHTRVMTLIRGRTRHCAPLTRPALTLIARRARIPVITNGPIRFIRVVANSIGIRNTLSTRSRVGAETLLV